jgi:hypothetical protein
MTKVVNRILYISVVLPQWAAAPFYAFRNRRAFAFGHDWIEEFPVVEHLGPEAAGDQAA